MNKLKENIFKHACYFIIVIIVFLAQTTPRFLEVFGIKPFLLLPLVVSIAMFEGEFIGGIYGAVAGLLLDYSATTYFGFNAMLFMVGCVLVGLLIIHLMQRNGFNCMFFCASILLVRGILELFFRHIIWGNTGVGILFLGNTIPTIIYSVCFAPLFFIMFQKISRYLNMKLMR
ncbi:MAG: rod shape-determining protein MreD [Oscillospiraceae bacterium]